ncbi:hypothetical protein D9758_005713 [Tetrapyrgos nigripes]|uniref:RING-14 protein n=1 Tax=Tetrapyrgos nigripes TaxID=182062 RepID=A0A8H5GJP6_9AGAR|nr:hypothetical protein D9758_005713 [Tetrapyrgos nigripes]
MHFSKTYSKLLQDLPPELRQNAIQYRQLKKLINQVVLELSSLGLSPQVLQELLDSQEGGHGTGPGSKTDAKTESPIVHPDIVEHGSPRVVYEINSKSGKIEPQLRVWITSPLPDVLRSSSRAESDSGEVSEEVSEEEGHEHHNEERLDTDDALKLLWALRRRAETWDDTDRIIEVIDENTTELSASSEPSEPSSVVHARNSSPTSTAGSRELVIPLVKDSAFFQLLSTALQGLSEHFSVLHTEFTDTLEDLAKTISDSTQPLSYSSKSFHPHSVVSSHPGEAKSTGGAIKSDLYAWREIFQLYIESEVFQSLHEAHPGPTSTEESERRLQLFTERITERDLGGRRKLRMTKSRKALETFLGINMFILNIKKLQEANAEATRKILKKHAKRTALPLPHTDASSPGPLALSLSSLSGNPQQPSSSHPLPSDPGMVIIGTSVHYFLPRILVQAIGETLLPIIPHIDDYSCVICTSIAFKPIRLSCGHLFCVRCLVKMQKRGQDACPMCRAPNVLMADQSNVDWALLNFMQDWFPVEARKKQKQGEKEAEEEHWREMGFDTSQKCVIM